MDLFYDLFRDVVGRAHFMVFMGKHAAAEVSLHGKDILVEIKNPIIAIEFGLEQILKGEGDVDVKIFERVKAMGYRIRIKYKLFEIDV
jgi:hypothetical protein